MTAQMTGTSATSAGPGGARTTPAWMKAIVQDTYGAPGEALRLEEIAVPIPKDNEVVVRVHAASVHVGLRKPKNRVPATDVAGTVEAVGNAKRKAPTVDAVDTGQILLLHPHAALSRFARLSARQQRAATVLLRNW